MRNRNVITVHSGAGPITGARGEVHHELMAVEVEVDPAIARSSLGATEQLTVEPSSRSEVVHRDGEVEAGPIHRRHGSGLLASALAGLLLLAACGDSESDADGGAATTAAAVDDAATTVTTAAPAATVGTVAPPVEEQLFPDVVAAELTPSGDGSYTVAATVSSPYDTPERYADAWRVVAPDGTVLGVRELAHDHQNEQPFTRQLTGVEIPAEVDEVTIEGRDQVSGWGGGTVTVPVPEG